MHRFSMTCKVDSVLDIFSTKAGREQAIAWFTDHHISKVYLESYRHRRAADADLLQTVKDDFTAAGLEVGGCITTTQMSRRVATWDIETCFTDPSAYDVLQEIVERTARVFDFIIFDDFFFTSCTCECCEQARNGRPWGDFRSELMLKVARERIVGPARAVNPNVKLIIKYPLWYESYYHQGYDVLRETDLFDYSWIGTETREPESVEAGRRPQTSASWIQGWMNAVSQGKCGGAWYDPIDTAPATFLEQARQSIIGGAEESLLHCYDYLATKTPGLAIHGKDREIQYGLADAEAFRHECDSLQWLAETLATMTPYGVAVPKQPNADPTTELFLPSFVGMLGIPAIAAASLADRGSAFLGAQAATFPKVISFIETALTDNRPLVVTAHLLAALENGHQLPENAFWQKLSAVGRTAADGGHTAADGGHTASLTDVTPGIAVLSCPEDLWQLMELDQGELDRFRNALLKPFGIEFFAPARVSLHLFASEDRHGEIVENFTDTPVTVTLRFATQNSRQRRCKLAVPTRESATLVNNDDSTYSLYLAPRSMALLLTE